MSTAEIVSAAVGLVLGSVAMLLWTALGRYLAEGRFWPSFGQLARDLVEGAPPERILREYAELIRLLAMYVGKTSCRVGIAILPVILCCVLLGPFAFSMALRSARGVAVYPVQSVHITLANRSLMFESARESSADPAQSVPVTAGTLTLTFEQEGLDRLRKEIERGPQLRIETTESEVVVPQWTAPVALSQSAWRCRGLQLLGMEARHTPNGPPLLIVRPAAGARNPLYPYLDEVELAFWSGIMASSIAAGIGLQLCRREVKQA